MTKTRLAVPESPSLNKNLANMGRKKIQIQLLDDYRMRKVMLKKRGANLFKKALEMAIMCECEVALIVINERNNEVETFSSTGSHQGTIDRVNSLPSENVHSVLLDEYHIRFADKEEKRKDYWDNCGHHSANLNNNSGLSLPVHDNVTTAKNTSSSMTQPALTLSLQPSCTNPSSNPSPTLIPAQFNNILIENASSSIPPIIEESVTNLTTPGIIVEEDEEDIIERKKSVSIISSVPSSSVPLSTIVNNKESVLSSILSKKNNTSLKRSFDESFPTAMTPMNFTNYERHYPNPGRMFSYYGNVSSSVPSVSVPPSFYPAVHSSSPYYYTPSYQNQMFMNNYNYNSTVNSSQAGPNLMQSNQIMPMPSNSINNNNIFREMNGYNINNNNNNFNLYNKDCNISINNRAFNNYNMNSHDNINADSKSTTSNSFINNNFMYNNNNTLNPIMPNTSMGDQNNRNVVEETISL